MSTTIDYANAALAAAQKAKVDLANAGKHPVTQADLDVVISNLDLIITPPAPTPTPTGFFLNPALQPVTVVAALQASGDIADATTLKKISTQPLATWLTQDSDASKVASIVSAAKAANEIPIFTIYNIPNRDNGGASSGGSASQTTYEAFIDEITVGLSVGVGPNNAIIILEPDAIDDNIETPNETTVQCLTFAYKTLKATGAKVYVDAGNPGWEPAGTVATVLNQIGTAVPFSVNVSNFYSTAASITYGQAVSAATGGGHFIIDTSRNGGTVTAGAWENPAGALLGTPPTTSTGNPLVDAFLWVKTPGQSDGNADGAPAAGQWYQSYALALCGTTPPPTPTPAPPSNVVYQTVFGTALPSDWWVEQGDGKNGIKVDAKNLSFVNYKGVQAAKLIIENDGTGIELLTKNTEWNVGQTLTIRAACTSMANWLALWAAGPGWPGTGEYDLLEGANGQATYNTHYANSQGVNSQQGPFGYGSNIADGEFHDFAWQRGQTENTISVDGKAFPSIPRLDTGGPLYPILTNGAGNAYGDAGAMYVESVTISS